MSPWTPTNLTFPRRSGIAEGKLDRRRFLYATALALPIMGLSRAGVARLPSAPERQSTEHPSREAILLQGVHVVAMDRERKLENQDVLLRRGRIERISPSGSAAVPSDVRVADVSGCYVMPGLADAHSHPPGPTGIDLPLERYFALTLAGGVTNLRWMRHDPAIQERTHVLEMAGKPVPLTFGCSVNVLEPPADWGRFREQLQEARSHHGRLVKILTGVGARELESIVDIATECGLKVAGHIPHGISVFEAIEAGMHGIEHASGYDRLVGDFSELRRAIHLSANRRVFNCPSIDWYRVYSTELDAHHSSLEELQSRRGVEFLPRPLRESWVAQVEQARAAGSYGSALLRKVITSFMAEEAVPLLVSAGDGAFIVPGFSLLEELRLFEAAGVSRYESLRAATIRMAEFFGEEAEWGTVEVGKKARLLLLEKDPLASLEAIGEIRAVVLDGRMVGRNELESSLQQSLEPLSATRSMD